MESQTYLSIIFLSTQINTTIHHPQTPGEKKVIKSSSPPSITRENSRATSNPSGCTYTVAEKRYSRRGELFAEAPFSRAWAFAKKAASPQYTKFPRAPRRIRLCARRKKHHIYRPRGALHFQRANVMKEPRTSSLFSPRPAPVPPALSQ